MVDYECIASTADMMAMSLLTYGLHPGHSNSFTLVTLSFFSFFVDESEITGRLSVTLTIVLTLVALKVGESVIARGYP